MTQPPPHPEQPLDLVICPECDAAVSATSRFCWLCRHQMDSPFKGRSASPFAPQGASAAYPGHVSVVAQGDPSRELVLNLSLAGVALVLVLMTVAVWMHEPFFGIALAFVLVPPLLITLSSGLISRLSGQTMKPAKRVAIFIKSAVATFVVAAVTGAVAIIVAAVVIISLIIALFEACFKMLGGG